MASELRQALESIERAWSLQQAPLVDALRPGLTDAQLDAAQNAFGSPFPTEVWDWYGWHDGVRQIGGPPSLLPSGGWLSTMEVALLRRRRTTEMWPPPGQEHESEDRYALTWLAITDHESFLVADCAGAATDPTAPATVHRVDFWPSEPWDRVLVLSLTELAHIWLHLVETGLWRWDPATGQWADTYAEAYREVGIPGLL